MTTTVSSPKTIIHKVTRNQAKRMLDNYCSIAKERVMLLIEDGKAHVRGSELAMLRLAYQYRNCDGVKVNANPATVSGYDTHSFTHDIDIDIDVFFFLEKDNGIYRDIEG